MFRHRLSPNERVLRDKVSAVARQLTRRRELALRQQLITWRRTALPIIGGAPGTPVRGGGTLPVLREPQEPHHLTLDQASILTRIPPGVLGQEARAGRVPGAYDAGATVRFDPQSLVPWVQSFWNTNRATRLQPREELEASYTVQEVAAALHVDESTVRKLLRQGDLTGLKMRKGVRIWRTSLDAYRERHAYRSAGERAAAWQTTVTRQSKQHDAAVKRLQELLQ